ncbi:MAG TPA: TetR/AcrR family transcriptional regulator [Candidatus Sulfotelmatobacter sp.]|nr:TetR/AcrR family transcriptional regulator [Candidatus Sulfotelmatobacter sp.]
MATETLSREPKEQQILTAAKELFLEKGYAATSMDMVAQRARASKTTLYTRFPSKEALFAATVKAECEARGMVFRPSDFDGVPIGEALYRIGRRFVDLICSVEAVCLHQVITGEAARFPEVAEAFKRVGPDRIVAAVADYFAQAKARGQLDIEDPLFAAEYFLTSLKGMPHGDLLLGVRQIPSEAERERFVGNVVRMFLKGATPR